jgi:hypothetical protein
MTDYSSLIKRLRDSDPWQVNPAADAIEALEAENEKLREAFGLISTISPHMEVDVNDYIGMVQKIYAENEKLLSRIESAEEAYVRLDAAMGRLKGAFRVNMLRCFSNMSHGEIDAAIRESGE